MKHGQITRQFLLLGWVLAVLSGCIPYSTGTTEVGVCVVRWNPLGSQGVIDKWYPEGETHFFIPFLTEWHTYSSNQQVIEMTYSPDTGDITDRDDLLFKTIDGNDIGLDVIIKYRIIREKTPYILRNIANTDEELRTNIVRTICRSKPRDIFGELTTEDFYVSGNREQKSEQAKVALNDLLNHYGVVIDAVLTKDYRFNKLYQKAIEERKIADQTAEKNKASARAAEQEYKRKIEEASGEVNKMTANVDGHYQQGKLGADAFYNSRVEIAQAIAKEGTTEAEGIRSMTEALTGPGGEVIVKMKIAEALKNKQIFLLPVSGGGIDLKTTDVNRLLETYGLQKAVEKKDVSAPSTSPKTQSRSAGSAANQPVPTQPESPPLSSPETPPDNSSSPSQPTP
ncbi:prohibitin family protein [bacterium]|nr:prohibitin family protein [bacterium]